MAKRKRLTLPAGNGQDPVSDSTLQGGLETKSMFPLGVAPRGPTRAPIARVAGEAAAAAALEEVAGELAAARAEGRLLQRLALDTVIEDHMLRDRIIAQDAEFESLVESLRLHGQRTPVEVTDLGDGRYGLISGWRRLTALRRLAAETGEARFSGVLALLRRPDTAADAYVAMVEENEIRSGLSYWERARIAARAVEAGVFPTEKIALQRLFAAASRARRSKIGSFLALYHALDGVLRFPAALSERAGLALARALAEDPGLGQRLRARIAAAAPDSAEAEQALIEALLETAPAPDPVPDDAGAPSRPVPPAGNRAEAARPAAPAPEDLGGGVHLRADLGAGRLVLSGPGVGPDLARRLRDWLRDARDEDSASQ